MALLALVIGVAAGLSTAGASEWFQMCSWHDQDMVTVTDEYIVSVWNGSPCPVRVTPIVHWFDSENNCHRTGLGEVTVYQGYSIYWYWYPEEDADILYLQLSNMVYDYEGNCNSGYCSLCWCYCCYPPEPDCCNIGGDPVTFKHQVDTW
jgi:hypothetical protein